MAASEPNQDLMPVKTALISVSDKTGLVDLGKALDAKGVKLLSTGGTAAALRNAGLAVTDVSDVTGHPECLDGRVKTLHPKIHGGILSRRDLADHEKQIGELGIGKIDLVVVNLYPFEETVAKGGDYDACVENIDIGGPAMVRAAAKNHAAVAIVTSTSQYELVLSELDANGGMTTLATRKKLAATAYARTAAYDTAVSTWFAKQLDEPSTGTPVARQYTEISPLKYGCNPHQKPASLNAFAGAAGLPFEIRNGTPGYINLLDALNAFQLAVELKQASGLPAAASFKHVSPAGAAVSVELTPLEVQVYEVKDKKLTPSAVAYVRARNADPLCSFGDFAALSEVVDVDTATFLKTEVSDGIIAPGFEPEALAILSSKKGGSFIVLEGKVDFPKPDLEYREVHGAVLAQKRNDVIFSAEHCQTIPTEKKLTDAAVRDLIVASIACKYTQSNSVVYAKDGQTVGVGAGQQSRVDCVKLAGRKLDTWWLRYHPKVLALPFKPTADGGPKKQERINARVAYIEGAMTAIEKARWDALLTEPVEPLTAEDKAGFIESLKGVAISSDAFFPFRDSIDVASQHGVEWVVQPGGSNRDDEVIGACNEYGMAMAMSGVRLFHH